MYDFHLHSRVSFDGRDTGIHMAKAAAAAGPKEICFTDHKDYDPSDPAHQLAFDLSHFFFADLGKIFTVGSDAYHADRVGRYCHEACQILRDIFGYVCTFVNRKPVFHSL